MKWPLAVISLLMPCSVGCAQTPRPPDVCKAELADLSSPGLEKIVFVRDQSGEAGYAFVSKSCKDPLPLSISSIPREGRIALNHLVRDLIEEDPSRGGIGVFEAQCDCDYDESANLVRAQSITSVRRFRSEAADRVGEDR